MDEKTTSSDYSVPGEGLDTFPIKAMEGRRSRRCRRCLLSVSDYSPLSTVEGGLEPGKLIPHKAETGTKLGTDRQTRGQIALQDASHN